LSDVSNAAKGEPAWPPLALLKAMLLSAWYDLSDVKLAEALDDRSSFRRFCGFSSSEPTPERTALVRFRRALVERKLDTVLFEAITAQLKAKAIRVKAGTLVDATIITSATEDDDEARWVKHKGKPAMHGFKAHVGADADTALVQEVAITPANVNDGKAAPDALPADPSEVFADSAYQGRHFGDAVRAKGARRASSPLACGAATKPKRSNGSMPGTGRRPADTNREKSIMTAIYPGAGIDICEGFSTRLRRSS
jgi:IS5 family transposase